MTEDQLKAKRARDAQRKREKRAAEKALLTQSRSEDVRQVKVAIQEEPGAAQTVLDEQVSEADQIVEEANIMIASQEAAKALAKAGFSFIRTEQGASGYSHVDGRAVLVHDDEVWTLRFADGTQTSGASQDSLLNLLAKTKTPKARRVEVARVRGQQGAASLGKHPVAKIPAVQALDIIANARDVAAAQTEARIVAAAEGRPLNVVRAVEMLKTLTDSRFDVQNLRGDKNYGNRMALLRVLFGREKGDVKVSETGINNVMQAFYSALGPTGNSVAAKAADFTERCAALLVSTHAAQLAAGKAAKKLVKAARRSVAPSLTVPGVISPAPKRLSRKAQREADDAVRREVYVEAMEAEPTAVPKPVLGALEVVQAHNLRLLSHPGGLVSLKLERCNSQGALHIWPSANGRRLCCGIMTPALAVGIKAQPYDLEAILAQVDDWLSSAFEKTEEMEDTLKKAKVAIKRQLEPVKLAPTALPIPAPREGAPEPRITPSSVRLLEDPRVGIILMQLEKENSQGAICVYNNSSRVSVGVVPPEILKTLRPVPGEVDLVKAANQLLNPVVPSVPVTPVAVGYLTAVLHCKEIVTMSKKFEAPVIEKPSKKFSAKTATVDDAKKLTKKSSAPKSTKAEKAPKTDRAPRGSYAGKKIRVVNKDLSGLREGTKRRTGVEIILKSKTTDDAIPALIDAGCNSTWLAFATTAGYVELV